MRNSLPISTPTPPQPHPPGSRKGVATVWGGFAALRSVAWVLPAPSSGSPGHQNEARTRCPAVGRGVWVIVMAWESATPAPVAVASLATGPAPLTNQRDAGDAPLGASSRRLIDWVSECLTSARGRDPRAGPVPVVALADAGGRHRAPRLLPAGARVGRIFPPIRDEILPTPGGNRQNTADGPGGAGGERTTTDTSEEPVCLRIGQKPSPVEPPSAPPTCGTGESFCFDRLEF
jgi:hypothetical protein